MAERFDFTAEITLTDTEQAIPQLYTQLAQTLRQGNRLPGEILLSERTASEKLGVSRSAIHKVYAMLCSDGLLRRDPGMRNYRISDFTEIDSGKNIGIVLPNSLREYWQDPRFRQLRQELYCGIADRSARAGIGTVILNLPEPGKRKSEVDRFFSRTMGNLLGVIHFGDRGPAPDPILERLWANEQIPQVLIFSYNKYVHCGSVSFDIGSGIQAIAQHLIETGRRNLAILYSVEPKPLMVHYPLVKFSEVREQFSNAWMNVRNEWCFQIEDRHAPQQIDAAVEQILASPKRPEAIWCRNDWNALELIRNLRSRGIRVPEEFAVVGTDDIAAAEESGLTTLKLPFYNMGCQAVEMLMAIRRERGGFTRRTKLLAPALMIRESTEAYREDQKTRL